MINLIMSEFGRKRRNSGDANLSKHDRFNPTLKTMLRYFPEIKLTIYTDLLCEDMSLSKPWYSLSNSNIEIIRPIVPFDSSHPRYGWRASSYFRAYGLANSEHKIAIAADADLYVLSDAVKMIIPLVERFGVCFPLNPRFLVKTDTLVGADSDKVLDETGGYGLAVNNGFMAADPTNSKAFQFLELYMKHRKQTGRGTIALWRATYESGHNFNPYVLPPQWCVCKKHAGIGDEIVLHVGHKKVQDFYKPIMEKQDQKFRS